ncbi:hypothetical protein ACFV2H_50930 [Streptomyces sp. NPDC059629]|uniref:hypothetical protein n=1 Tax=Streptomyces sp. NPDC059629 TaxID=3346889 RepID=UPI0036BCA684
MDRFGDFRVGHGGIGGRDAGHQTRRRPVRSTDRHLTGNRILVNDVVAGGSPCGSLLRLDVDGRELPVQVFLKQL